MADIQQNPWLATRNRTGDEYDATYERREAAGEDVHGEANFVEQFAPKTVLDAGCGTGRIGRELAGRGREVVGVDLDDEMLATARRKGPHIQWLLADLADVDLDRRFDAILMAGNVIIFLTPGTERTVLSNMARHLNTGGVLIAGFQLQPGGLTIGRYDELCAAAGLVLDQRWSTWDRDPWVAGGGYAVSVHRASAKP